MNNCSHTCILTMQAISESDSFTTCSKRDVADVVESRSEKFQENEKKKVKFSKGPLSLHSFFFTWFITDSKYCMNIVVIRPPKVHYTDNDFTKIHKKYTCIKIPLWKDKVSTYRSWSACCVCLRDLALFFCRWTAPQRWILEVKAVAVCRDVANYCIRCTVWDLPLGILNCVCLNPHFCVFASACCLSDCLRQWNGAVIHTYTDYLCK